MHLNRKIIKIILIVLASMVIIFSIMNSSPRVCIENKKCFNVKISDNSLERQIGLSNHTSLEQNSGMLFVFSESEIQNFWMKNMRFNIDLIWIDSNLKIIGFEKDMVICWTNCPLYSSDFPIKYVLEINSGLIDDYNFRINDSVNLDRVKI